MTAPDEPRSDRPSTNGRRLRPVSDRHLTIADVCEELGIARSTFCDWRAKRKGPRCFRLPNGDLRIRRSDYEDWISSLEDEVA
jgi:predicted DNA-binding transcriptional regulator AlpA